MGCFSPAGALWGRGKGSMGDEDVMFSGIAVVERDEGETLGQVKERWQVKMPKRGQEEPKPLRGHSRGH